jgi:S1-C subfamily serine protease
VVLILQLQRELISSFPSDGTILTSAKIDAGNSGGLAIDRHGCMVGITTAVWEGEYQNLGIIIPVDMVREFVDKAKQLEKEDQDLDR